MCRPRVKAETSQIHRPDEMGKICDDQCPRLGAVGRLHDGGVQPFGRAVGNALLEEVRAVSAVGEALQQHRPIAHLAHDCIANREVVLHEIELGIAAGCEEDLVGAGDRDGSPGHRDLHWFAHDSNRIPSRQLPSGAWGRYGSKLRCRAPLFPSTSLPATASWPASSCC